jgi:hypothetical protein
MSTARVTGRIASLSKVALIPSCSRPHRRALIDELGTDLDVIYRRPACKQRVLDHSWTVFVDKFETLASTTGAG